MSCICESPNFMWSTQDFLGEGATATVYKGVNKSNGDFVAVKCYRSSITHPEYQFREFEVLKHIKHENIVKLIAIEENQMDRRKVIITELCIGGNLLDDIQDPRNAYGLEESEFLRVLRHLYGGMKYLRDKNIVHRDLKPGNIMKCIQDDGTNVYKLADFGVARELTDDETFQTICGTKAYLHPDVYEQGVLGRRSDKTFNSSVDLWSIGVTLYHLGTGSLPFIAYQGYGSKDTLHYITTKKESGVISGIQTKEKGPIKWNRELPETCLLSNGLKKLITPIIAGLLETNPSKAWGFDKFFNEVEILLSRVIVNIFYVNKATLIKLYMLPDQKYDDLEEHITYQTYIDGDNQILLFKNDSIKNFIQNFTRVVEYPKTSEDQPFFLFNREHKEFLVTPIEIPKWMDFPINISMEKDGVPAQRACFIGHHCERQIDKYSLHYKLIKDSIEILMNYIDNDVKYMQLNAQNLLEKIRVYEKAAKMLQMCNGQCESNFDKNLKKITNEFVTITELVTNLYNLQHFENNIKSNWELVIKTLICPDKSLASIRGKTHVKELRKSYQYFLNEPSITNMSYSKSQLHVLERKRVRQRLYNIITLLEKEIFPQYQQVVKGFEDLFVSVENIFLKIKIFKSEITQSEEKLKDFENEFTVDYDNYVKNKDQLSKNNANAENVQKTKQFETHLKDYFSKEDNFNEIISENTRLMNQIQNFISNV